MKRRTRIAISALCGVAAAALALSYASSVRSEAERMRRETLESYGGDLVAVCVATRDIEPGDTLDESNVAVEEWVASLLPPDAVTSLADVAGKVATSRIPQRAVLCPAYVEARAGDLEVPDGCVAVSVASDAEHAVGGALARGDAVDVYVSKDAVADRLTSARVLDTSALATGGGEVSWVTLAVEPSCVQELLAAMSLGQVTLVVPGEMPKTGQEDES
ncbi:Flp pilus assembly protein CpaB [Collinsella tanakaei]|uniref:Flp pilus assembly protein CpaB n=1 Tax=Collinsella tanakaei TaxID=626935 RepID=UPI0025A47775|nr:Flp pilus assembly protein CpaB [Collinsella tanakaei]MDM8300466.1 Flp pilus assembly protein CpaB [Collinsella tanakaei]